MEYNNVQTGPNSQLGGEKEGLFRVAYHVGIAEIVKGILINPTSSQTKIAVISFKKFFTLS